MAPQRTIVVGGGLSGLSAAHTLVERGGNVLVLDKNGFFGGNSTKATSGINGAGTRTQQEQGVKDSVKAFFEDTKKSAKDLARDDLIQVLTGNSADAVHWLQDKFKLDLSVLGRLGGHSYQRTHRGGAQFPGMVITYALMEGLENLAENSPDRVQILKKARVTKLLYEGDAVTGVEYEYKGQKYTEKGAVILATGGYAADFSPDGMLAKYRPDTLKLSTTNGDHCTGDGLKMAMAIGAKGIDLEKVQVHPTGLIDPKEQDAKVKFLAAEALRGAGGLLLDGKGDRFCDELGTRDYVTGRIWDNGVYPVRLILNGGASKEIEWHCKHYTGRGLMKRFESGADLAKDMGISEDKLKSTFDEYNQIAAGKKSDPWGKKFFSVGDWKMDDFFHVAWMEPVLHYTMGGLEVNAQSQVMNKDGKPIPGLWASGEVAGGVHGANRLGGSSLLGCVVFGRVAGDEAAAYMLQQFSSGKIAGERLNQVANHLETKIRIDPSTNKAVLEFSWAGQEGASSSASSSSSQATPAAASAPPHETDNLGQVPHNDEKKQSGKKELKEITMDEVAKHNDDKDPWVVVGDQVLAVKDFLPDHPGGAKAIMLYAGRDATEEFDMLHDRNVIPKYASDTVIGTIKK
ncbi:Flavocytochrome c [Cystobasidium minutum MCA 4210]|uniref:Flavocytochrome c n=1 Tax=Cystobasidium minutum MCA 4210 TaxID=1397322 RepID=UPI0034CE5BFF|eukprot:jgi/Rhomi1/170635/fgenesh1_kg.4_\